MTQALALGKQSLKPEVELVDTVLSSQLLIYPLEGNYYLAYKVIMPTNRGFSTVLYLNAKDGKLLGQHDNIDTCVPTAWGNVFLRHPILDGYVYTTVVLPRLAQSGYLDGTYASVHENLIEQYYGRLYRSDFDFTISDMEAWHFDAVNVYYHVDRFRNDYWNPILGEVGGWTGFTQITANVYVYPYYLAWYDPPTGTINFGIGHDAGINSLALEDKVIMHEYSHAIVKAITQIDGSGDDQSGAINEGMPDYFAGSFTYAPNNREWINDYAAPTHPELLRSFIHPRIQDITDYHNADRYSPYGIYEKHYGGEFWSYCLWSMRSSPGVGQDVADQIISKSIFSLVTHPTFVQARQAIIAGDNTMYAGQHVGTIAHSFYLRGIGNDALGTPSISGTPEVYHPNKGQPANNYTWTATVTGGTAPISYAWYKTVNGQYYQVGTGSSYSEAFYFGGTGQPASQFTLRVDALDGNSQLTSNTFVVDEYWPGSGGGGGGAELNNQEADALKSRMLPAQYAVSNYPNPFNPSTTISYQLPEDASIQLEIYDMMGKRIAVLVNANKSAGYYSVVWSGKAESGAGVASGMYLYRFTATPVSGQKAFSRSGKLLMMK